MSLTINLYYTGKNGSARRFMDEMEASGIADRIRKEDGNERYEYFIPANDPETVLLIDSWKDQESIERHHQSEMMNELAALREKYDLHMKVERFVSAEEPDSDQKYIRK
ncbi:MAG: antibiotic biosynthesis monooxygenase [Limosilactobacillus sp.]|uniref:putative quinol monooxygenase n=1 Tax=Limosilactobacillus sp. TaxID=2773925 RepID=UPI002701D73C|nr:antibiotic biosynthesis monooxygenase [Limosilactobacillus sp.]